MSQLRVGLVQYAPIWENPAANRAQLEEQLSGWEGKVDIVVLPEMFTTGFTMNPGPNAEIMEGPTHRWMKLMAKRLQAALAGSCIIRDGGQFWNRLLWVEPDGKTVWYDKTHLFSLAGEDAVYQAGKERTIISFRDFTICPLICYDLRFGYLSQQNQEELIDLYLYVASWPEPRKDAWSTLLKARAIENQAFVVGVNRTGKDGSGWSYVGGSCAYDGLGISLAQAGTEEEMQIVLLNREVLWESRTQFPFWQDQKKGIFFGGKFGN